MQALALNTNSDMTPCCLKRMLHYSVVPLTKHYYFVIIRTFSDNMYYIVKFVLCSCLLIRFT